MKRGRKKGQKSNKCKLAFCRNCDIYITPVNASGYRRSGPMKDRALTLCKDCARDEQVIKMWRLKPVKEIQARITWHFKQIILLKIAIQRKPDRS